VTALFLLLFEMAFAFETTQTATGADMVWTLVPIDYTVNLQGLPPELDRKGISTAIDRSFLAWERVEGADVAFVWSGDSANEVHWDSAWPYDPDVMALTSTWATDSGVLLAFDVAINGQGGGWTLDASGRDLQNAMTHEVGHVLGLAHNGAEPEATMFPTTVIGETSKRDLHEDDEAGVRYLYPQAVDGVFLDASCSSTAVSPSALVMLLVAGLASRRRRSA